MGSTYRDKNEVIKLIVDCNSYIMIDSFHYFDFPLFNVIHYLNGMSLKDLKS